jgi:hypothetical protein
LVQLNLALKTMTLEVTNHYMMFQDPNHRQTRTNPFHGRNTSSNFAIPFSIGLLQLSYSLQRPHLGVMEGEQSQGP